MVLLRDYVEGFARHAIAASRPRAAGPVQSRQPSDRIGLRGRWIGR